MAAGFWTPPSYGTGPMSMGSVQDMARAQLQADAAAASRSQAGQLLEARLAGIRAPNVGPIPTLPEGAVMSPASAQSAAFPRALGAGPPVAELGGNPAAAGMNAVGSDLAAAGATGEAASGAGLLGRLGAATGLGGGGVGGALSVMKGRVGPALAYAAPAEALGYATQIAGVPVAHLLGMQVSPDAIQAGASAGKDVGTGAALGTLIAPGPGTVIGATAMGLKDVGKEAANLWGGGGDSLDSAVARFDKAIGSFHKFGADAHDYVNNTYYNAAQARLAQKGDLGQAATYINHLTDLMGKDHQTMVAAKRNGGANGSGDARLAIQMGQAMGQLSQGYIDSAHGAAEMERQQAAAQPSLAPVLNADAASREAYAKQMGGAFQAAAYVNPTINKMDQQIAYQQQLLQSIRAAQLSGSSTSLSGQLATGTAPVAGGNAANAQAQANALTAQQAAAMAQLGG